MDMQAVHVIRNNSDTKLEISETIRPEPKNQELLIKVEATALNRADLLQRAGNYPVPEGASEILGLEMSGTVEAAGTNVTDFKEGDQVFGLLAGGGYAEYCTIHQDLVMRKPDRLSFEEAAAIPETFLTAYQAMVWLGELKQKETILIHAGASGVGTSAIQLASQLFDATIITTASQQHKLDTCKDLGADYTINYKEEDFREVITDQLGKHAVDVVIDFVGAPYWQKNIDVLAVDGRMVYLSFLGGHKIENMSLVPILRKRLSIKGSTLRNRSEEYKIKLTQEFSKHTLDLFKEGKLKPVIDSIYDWKDTEEAHQRMRNNKNTGKIVLTGT